MDFGEAPLFSSSRIIGNLTQYLAPNRPQVLSILHDTPGCLQRLASLLLPQPRGGVEVRDPEIKYNAVASLSTLILDDSDVAMLVAGGGVLGLISMLHTPDELTQQHVVQILKKMVKHEACREEMRSSRECISLIFESSAEAGLRYPVLEIILELTKQDSGFLSSVPESKRNC